MASPSKYSHHTSVSSRSPEELSEAEKQWVDFQPYLLSKGYQLSPRYRPGWVPSWIHTGANPYECEDSGDTLPVRVIDATRVIDGVQVMIKMLVPIENDLEGKQELEVLQMFSSPPHSLDQRNHAVPCLDTFPIPGVDAGSFYVMPLLTKYNQPVFTSLGEIQNFLVQIFEGLLFLHNNDVVHCDIASPNIMMNGRLLYDEPFHPFNQHLALHGKRLIRPQYSRSQVPIRYYFIDFGYARWFRASNEPRRIRGMRARELTPEQASGLPYDPFKADIFQLGAVLRRDLIPYYPILRPLLPLARGMTAQDPAQRPTLDEALRVMKTHFGGVSGWQTRWPIIPQDASPRQRFIYTITGIIAELLFLLRHTTDLLLMRSP